MFRSPGPIALAFQLPADLPLVGGLSVSIRWYGVLIASSMALGLWLVAREAARRGESPDDLLKAAEIALIGGLIGARLYYVLFNLDYYQTQPWWRIFAVWEGGLAIHGGLIAGLLAGGAYVWAKGLPLLRLPGHRGARGSCSRRRSAGGATSSTRRPSGGRPTSRGSSTSPSRAGRPPSWTTSTSTPPSSTSRSGTSGPSSSSTSCSGGGSSGRRAPCSSPTSGSTRSDASGSRGSGPTASCSARSGSRSS